MPIVPPLFEHHGALVHHTPFAPSLRFQSHRGGNVIVPKANGHVDVATGVVEELERHSWVGGRVDGVSLLASTRKFPV